MTALLWFRQDLRLSDNPAATQAARQGPVVPVYILDDSSDAGARSLGGASRWWLHHSLSALRESLGGLVLCRGNPREILPALAQQTGAGQVYWNRCYEPWAVTRDGALKSALRHEGLEVESFNSALLHEPWELKTGAGAPYKVYTPYWRAALRLAAPPAQPAARLTLANLRGLGEKLDDWGLLPRHPNWAALFERSWKAGEAAARERLRDFLKSGLSGYATLRDWPDCPNVSRLSPHLHWGEISPRQIWAATQAHLSKAPRLKADADKFLAELGWREFAYHLLYHFPDTPRLNWKREFDAYPWQNNPRLLRAWQTGQTGYPLVDAGLRELWATGYMHNRVRLVAASFLIKHLRIDWREGERWFWDTLVDADLANNVAGWQWVAGSGADASPYFRVFNPIEQGRKFDPDGHYVRRWCPQLAQLPDRYLHAPFEAPADMLAAAGVRLGVSYPTPVVEHAAARAAALAGYARVTGGNDGSD